MSWLVVERRATNFKLKISLLEFERLMGNFRDVRVFVIVLSNLIAVICLSQVRIGSYIGRGEMFEGNKA